MLNLEWKATAIADLLAIVDYISDDNPDAAQALKDEIEAKTSRLPDNPQLYRVGRAVCARIKFTVPVIRYSSSAMSQRCRRSRGGKVAAARALVTSCPSASAVHRRPPSGSRPVQRRKALSPP